jgi:hypothetical protein
MQRNADDMGMPPTKALEDKAWRSRYFCDLAADLERKAKDMLDEAARLRGLASKINPTTGSGL